MVKQNQLDFPAELWLPFIEQRSTVTCATSHLIYLQGSNATCFYYLKKGKVKSFIQSEDGGERVLRIYRTGDILGVASFFDELPRVSSAIAVSRCEVIPIDRKLVAQTFSQNPDLAMSVIQYLARAVRLMSEQVDDMAFRPAPERLARYLLAESADNNVITTTQEELATSISVSRVTVNRVLSEFTSKGWVSTEYRGIIVQNKTALHKLISTSKLGA